MAKVILTLFVVVAVLAVGVFSAAVPAKVGDLPCLGCELLAGAVEVELAQGKSQDTVVQDIKSLCGKLPKPLQVTCKDFIQHDMTKFVAAVAICNGNLKQACQSVDQCKTTQVLVKRLETNPIDCFNCKLLATFIANLMQHGDSKEKIEKDALTFCSKLLPPIKDSCTNVVTTQLKNLLVDIQAANGNATEACIAFGRCKSKTMEFAQVEGPLDCVVCKVEGSMLKAAMDKGKDKATIETDMLNVCLKLPGPLAALCSAKISTDIDPLLDALAASSNDVQKSCESLKKCDESAAAADALLELENSLECSSCKVVASVSELLVKEGKTKEQIDAKLKEFCSHLAEPLKTQCEKQAANLDVLLSALELNNGDALSACQAVGKCTARVLKH